MTDATHKVLCRVIRTFDWGDYGMDSVEYQIKDDPKAQEWIPDLASKVQAVINDEHKTLMDRLLTAERLLDELTDPDDCWFDHHGGCQAHSFLSLEHGEKCPNQESKDLLAK